MNEVPNFLELNAIEENLLLAKLDAVRAAIAHAGEKGRALENGVHTLVRSILPAEYGLATGFVVFDTPEGPRLSSQLDIIIYDAIRSGPIISLETCDVFPLEAVYGYVEVKATLRSSSDEAEKPADNSIEKCLITNRELRSMRDRRYHLPFQVAQFKHFSCLRSGPPRFPPYDRTSLPSRLRTLLQRILNGLLREWRITRRSLATQPTCTDSLWWAEDFFIRNPLTWQRPPRKTTSTSATQRITPYWLSRHLYFRV